MSDPITTTVNADTGEVIITRELDAPRETVFKAFFEPAQLARFWGPVGTHTPESSVVIEARPGGRFETVMVNDADGSQYPTSAVFVEILEPERWSFREPDAGMTTNVTLTDLGDGRTRLVIHQTNVPEMYRSPEALAGFKTSIERMAAYVASL